MSILQELLTWNADLPDWQSDALRKMLLTSELQPSDVERLHALLKAEHGIPDPAGRTAVRLTAGQVPVPAGADRRVELLEMKNLQRVNAIAENQSVAFSPSGITVIYGDNGSGKSGYSRVLKRACRARDQAESIHPDARSGGGAGTPAEVDMVYSVDGSTLTAHWVDGEPAPDALSSLRIFDSRCARAYLDKEDDFSYIPYGFDVFERLAALSRQLKAMVKSEIEQCAVDRTAFAHLDAGTEVGRLVAGMTRRTAPALVEKLGTLTEVEESRLAELAVGLKVDDPKVKAQELRLKASRLEKIATTTSAGLTALSEEKAAELGVISSQLKAAKAAADTAASSFKSQGELLPGTGGEAWRSLFDAARAFALESHPEEVFPDLDPASPCPLCQQPLQEGAQRLRRFDDFINQETARKLVECQKAADLARDAFLSSATLQPTSDETLSEIKALNDSLHAKLRAFEGALSARHSSFVSAVGSGDWTAISSLPEEVSTDLMACAHGLKQQALTLEEAADETTRAKLVAEHAELSARRELVKVKAAVLTAIGRLALSERLGKCLKPLHTRTISTKSREVSEAAVSADLARTLNKEFKTLGVSDLHVTLKSRPDKGRVLHKLVLELPGVDNPGAILSEGEQRAIAIGSFLAEVGLAGDTAGIVFDDPVCSLDHRRRERVAKRLVEEAKRRQVIVLSHDIYFICILLDIAGRESVPTLAQSLARRPEGFGVVGPDLPFEGKKTSARVGELRQLQQAVAKLKRDGNDSECERMTLEAYRKLRLAWERGVEEVLLRQVVLRFRKGIETQRLSELVVDDGDYRQVEAGMARCSDYAHDKALEGGIALPDPEDLLQDIELLESWRASLEARAAETRKRRKASATTVATGS
jgi:energy-coupling factor transporter ATP-binding protein EcfA2